MRPKTLDARPKTQTTRCQPEEAQVSCTTTTITTTTTATTTTPVMAQW